MSGHNSRTGPTKVHSHRQVSKNKVRFQDAAKKKRGIDDFTTLTEKIGFPEAHIRRGIETGNIPVPMQIAINKVMKPKQWEHLKARIFNL